MGKQRREHHSPTCSELRKRLPQLWVCQARKVRRDHLGTQSPRRSGSIGDGSSADRETNSILNVLAVELLTMLTMMMTIRRDRGKGRLTPFGIRSMGLVMASFKGETRQDVLTRRRT